MLWSGSSGNSSRAATSCRNSSATIPVRGAWAELFRKNTGFCGTELLRDAENPRRFVTIDRWESMEAQAAMRGRFAKEWEELDRKCEVFTELERRIGVFEER
jgi:quinol monooxygenase YgiN